MKFFYQLEFPKTLQESYLGSSNRAKKYLFYTLNTGFACECWRRNAFMNKHFWSLIFAALSNFIHVPINEMSPVTMGNLSVCRTLHNDHVACGGMTLKVGAEKETSINRQESLVWLYTNCKANLFSAPIVRTLRSCHSAQFWEPVNYKWIPKWTVWVGAGNTRLSGNCEVVFDGTRLIWYCPASVCTSLRKSSKHLASIHNVNRVKY